MKPTSRYSDWLINLLVALAISAVVNFSSVLWLLVNQQDEPVRVEKHKIVEKPGVGVLSVTGDGHGYLIYENGDSLYVPMHRLCHLGLSDGDRIEAGMSRIHATKGHPMLAAVYQLNGEPFDASRNYNRPSAQSEIAIQLLYYMLLSFLLLQIHTITGSDKGNRHLAQCYLLCLIVAAAVYLFAPVVEWRSGRLVFNFMTGHMFDYMILLKWCFAVAVSLLYGRIYQLISQRQEVVIENERLKNENLTTRYNMLVEQITPHFFFNSLNSLAMLVREKEEDKALTYIDQLSYTFRYILQNGQSTLVPLAEEMKFTEAYGYLFKIRYADKLFIDETIDENYLSWRLPALSLQPLLGNAVKHNAITHIRPFHISIRTEGSVLVISNPKIPKLTAEPSTGIGLANLRNRWRLIVGSEIEIIDTAEEFIVRLPLQKPEA